MAKIEFDKLVIELIAVMSLYRFMIARVYGILFKAKSFTANVLISELNSYSK